MQIHTTVPDVTSGALWDACFAWLIDGQIPAKKPVVYCRMVIPAGIFDEITAHRDVVPLVGKCADELSWEAIPGTLTVHRGAPEGDVAIAVYYNKDMGTDGDAYELPAMVIFDAWVKAIGGTKLPLN